MALAGREATALVGKNARNVAELLGRAPIFEGNREP